MAELIRKPEPKWTMAIDTDRCSGCQACVVACQAENNIPLNTDEIFNQKRAMEWIRIERYWVAGEGGPDDKLAETDFRDVRAKFIPVLCQHCDNAPCEPVCPVYATYQNPEGLNVQVYNRCVGTFYCANNCRYTVRSFKFFPPEWPEPLEMAHNPDVAIRMGGVM